MRSTGDAVIARSGNQIGSAIPAALEGPRAPVAVPGIGRIKLAAGAAAFLALTVAVFWYQFARSHATAAGPRWDQLRWGYFLLILLCLPMESLAAASRTWLICRVLEPGVRFWTCVKAEWANVAMNLLTPAHSGGGPAQMYMLTRDGARAGTALTISLLGFLGTMIGLLGMGLYSLLVSGLGQTGSLFLASVGALVTLTGAMLLGATCPSLIRCGLGFIGRAVWRASGRRGVLLQWWPPHAPRTGPPVDRLDSLTAKLADLVYTYHHDVRQFLHIGKAHFVGVCLLSALFLSSRVLLAYLSARFLGLETASLARVAEIQMAVTFVIFFAPTPGGAGLAEGASLALMTEIVPVGFAPYYNLLWRLSTAYVGALAGLYCLGCALAKDVGSLVRRVESTEGTTAVSPAAAAAA